MPLVRPGKWLAGLAGFCTAAGILWAGAYVHLERACTLMDTPYLPLCPARSESAADVQHELRDRLRRNPGDSGAWTKLLVATKEPRDESVLRAATVVAPNHPNVLRARAAYALEQDNLPEAVALLVQMLRTRGTNEAAQVLARLLATEQGRELLRPQLKEAQYWLRYVLAVLPTLDIPPGQALPLVVEALHKRALPADATRAYMKSLKNGGHWVDAYGLWLALHKQQVPLLYNGSFDQAFVQDGFDWEFTPVTRSRAGVLIEQHAVARRGSVLELEFTGRSFKKPILRQYVFLAAGSYRLRGEYRAMKLRSEEGLSWTVSCASGQNAVTAQSSPMQDTGGVWKVIEFEFKVPSNCGPIASIQLEPTAAYEAVSGIKGRMALDGFELAPPN